MLPSGGHVPTLHAKPFFFITVLDIVFFIYSEENCKNMPNISVKKNIFLCFYYHFSADRDSKVE